MWALRAQWTETWIFPASSVTPRASREKAMHTASSCKPWEPKMQEHAKVHGTPAQGMGETHLPERATKGVPIEGQKGKCSRNKQQEQSMWARDVPWN